MARLVERIQIVLMIVSVTAVVDASRIAAAEAPAGYRPARGAEDERSPDRRFADLARLDRKEREELQREIRRSGRFRVAAVDAIEPPPRIVEF
jgi:hypothetical protein